VLAERVVLSEQGFVSIPQDYSFEQAATLPCVAVTAWQALTLGRLQAGQTILMLVSGCVSVFAL
jgi:NADPH:quinone reductase-like Zn-dependent oxidoreductase